MANRNYRNGRAREYHAIKLLREQGYECVRAAGSKGQWDVVAWREDGLRFIQVKKDCKPSDAELASMKYALVPQGRASKEVWIFRRNQPLEIVRL